MRSTVAIYSWVPQCRIMDSLAVKGKRTHGGCSSPGYPGEQPFRDRKVKQDGSGSEDERDQEPEKPFEDRHMRTSVAFAYTDVQHKNLKGLDS
jgi:hypothetical protein